MSVNRSKSIKLEVSFGPKAEKLREVKSFDNEKQADAFFQQKQAEGLLYVDAYRVETVVSIKKVKLTHNPLVSLF